MPVFYTAVERFGPANGESWRNFVEWSGLTHLKEVASFDGMLRPSAFGDLTDEDWQHNAKEMYLTGLFLDLGHVLKKLNGNKADVLALLRNPTAFEVGSFADPRYAFRGFDLVESETGISAVVNCGGFDRAFSPSDLSDCGLITDFTRASEVRDRLRTEYPDEPHAGCDLWATCHMTSLEVR